MPSMLLKTEIFVLKWLQVWVEPGGSPAQHGSIWTMFHKANMPNMAPCLWLCSVDLVPERKKSGGSDQRKCAEVSCSLFFCLLSPL